jgi:hypothetical protein
MKEAPLELEVSELKVMHSAAGYYIGREQWEYGCWFPYSRESMRYWPTFKEAYAALVTGVWANRDYALENQK